LTIFLLNSKWPLSPINRQAIQFMCNNSAGGTYRQKIATTGSLGVTVKTNTMGKTATLFLITLLDIIPVTLFSQNQLSPKIVLMKIRFVDMNTETPMRINCNTFPYYFGNSCKNIHIRDSTFLKRFRVQLNTTKEINSEYLPDVRVQLELFCNDGISRMLCFGDDKILVYDCKKLEYNDSLIKPILKIISEQLDK
jgi:hypothetical protein